MTVGWIGVCELPREVRYGNEGRAARPKDAMNLPHGPIVVIEVLEALLHDDFLDGV